MHADPLLVWYKSLMWVSVAFNVGLAIAWIHAASRLRQLKCQVDAWRAANAATFAALRAVTDGPLDEEKQCPDSVA